MRSKKLLLLNGPNLNMLGSRNEERYGKETLSALVRRLRNRSQELGYALEDHQSNNEGDLITLIQHAKDAGFACIIINPGGLTHTSVSLRDAVEIARDLGVPSIEVHLSNIEEREEFRRHSMLSPGDQKDGMWVVIDRIAGKKSQSYFMALDVIIKHLEKPG